MKFLFLLFAMIALDAQASGRSGICPRSFDQTALNECTAKMAKAADASLASFYATYTKRFRPDQVELFHTETSDWLRHRDSYCKFEASGVAGGSAYPMAFHLCLADQAQVRLQALRKLSRCQPGDLSCPTQ